MIAIRRLIYQTYEGRQILTSNVDPRTEKVRYSACVIPLMRKCGEIVVLFFIVQNNQITNQPNIQPTIQTANYPWMVLVGKK